MIIQSALTPIVGVGDLYTPVVRLRQSLAYPTSPRYRDPQRTERLPHT
jgi:hypothetical protein